jgi:hypothetical protein
MSNRLTKGEALVGAVKTDADMNIGDDAYIMGAFGKGITVTTEADGASMLMTAAELLGGITLATPTEARNIQVPAAADIITAVDAGTDTGLGFEFTVINLASATHALTLTVNTGTTLVGSVTIAAASSATFVARIASGTTVVIYRK